MTSLFDTSSHDQQWESNSILFYLKSNALSTWLHAPKGQFGHKTQLLGVRSRVAVSVMLDTCRRVM